MTAKIPDNSVLALCGGVGGAKLALGLSRTLGPDELLIAVNTGDDFLHLGLHISPDLDTVMYTLAGAADPERGWGVAGETWNFMEAIARFDGSDWFKLGDRDLATHVYRTRALQHGLGLAEVTKSLCDAFGIEHRVLPMTDDPLQTIIVTGEGELPFQDYFARLRCRPRVRSVRFNWVELARPHPEFAALLNNPELRAVVLCPSNPFLSIDPILSLEGVRPALLVHPCAGRRGIAHRRRQSPERPRGKNHGRTGHAGKQPVNRRILPRLPGRPDHRQQRSARGAGNRKAGDQGEGRQHRHAFHAGQGKAGRDNPAIRVRVRPQMNYPQIKLKRNQGVSPRLPGCGGHPGCTARGGSGTARSGSTASRETSAGA